MFVTNLQKDFYDVIQRSVSRCFILGRDNVFRVFHIGYIRDVPYTLVSQILSRIILAYLQ